MSVWRFKLLVVAGLALAGIGSAQAADYAPPPPPPVYVQPPPPPQEDCCDSWYLRGFVGAGMNSGASAEFIQNPANNSNFGFDSTSYSDQMFIGGGVGYAWNNWLRIEGTAEYRSKSHVYAFGHYTNGGGTFLDTYDADIKSWIFLANAFIDLGTWNCFTPFVGGGIGVAYNTLTNFSDVNPSLAGYGTGTNSSEWHLAWALYAGVSYEVTKNFSMDLTYRYLSYGSVTGQIDCASGCNGPDSFKFGNLHSQDIMLGFRWMCCDLPTPQPRYVYTPPAPVYTEPPPLRSRG
jgi:opacity protein-like surface antigen